MKLILLNTPGRCCYWNWYCKTPSTDIGIDVDIAKHPPPDIVLKLLLQKCPFWYCNWCCYCKPPLTKIVIDIGIAKLSSWQEWVGYISIGYISGIYIQMLDIGYGYISFFWTRYRIWIYIQKFQFFHIHIHIQKLLRFLAIFFSWQRKP